MFKSKVTETAKLAVTPLSQFCSAGSPWPRTEISPQKNSHMQKKCQKRMAVPDDMWWHCRCGYGGVVACRFGVVVGWMFVGLLGLVTGNRAFDRNGKPNTYVVLVLAPLMHSHAQGRKENAFNEGA